MNIKDILAKDPAALSDAEKAFLREHVADLSDDDKTKFTEALKSPEGTEQEEIDVEGVKSLVLKSVEDALAVKVDQISNDIVGKFNQGVKTQRAKAQAGEPVEKNEKADDVTRKFMKALISGDKAAAKALTTSSSGQSPDDAQAGLLIPTELLTEVLRIRETQYGLARRDMRYLPFSGPGDTRTIPTLGTSVSVYWTGEGEKKKSTQPKFSIVTQTLKKLAAITPFTEEILEDSAINLTQLVAELFAEAVSKEEDIQFFNGTGTPWTGILHNGSVNIVLQATGDVDQLTADDLLDMIDKTPSGSLDGAKFYMHRTVFSVIRKLKGTDGQYIVQMPTGSQPGTIWGYPYELSDAFPTKASVTLNTPYILFANLKQAAIFGDKQQLRVKLLEEATITDTDDSTVINLAEQDMIALRIVERVGYVVALASAATVLKAQAHES